MSTAPETSAAGYVRTRFAADPRRAALWRHLTAYLTPFVPADGSVLELGAGYCHFINAVPARRRVAVDVGAHTREAAAQGVEVHEQDAVTFLAGAAPGSFDFILASNFLEHLEWPDLNRLLPLLRGALRPGGRLALIQPNFRIAPRRYFDDYTHRTIFTDESLCDWLTAGGFAIEKTVPRFLPLTVKSRLGSFAFLVPLYLRLPWRPLAGQMFVLATVPLTD